jgi:hypothetical protein
MPKGAVYIYAPAVGDAEILQKLDSGVTTNFEALVLIPAGKDAMYSDFSNAVTSLQAIDMGGFGINNVLNPILAQDVATKDYVDTTSGSGATTSLNNLSAVALGGVALNGAGNYVPAVDGASAIGTALLNFGDVHSQSLQSNTDLYISSDGGGISFNNAGSIDFNGISMETAGNFIPSGNGVQALGTAALNFGDVHSQSLQSNTDLYISAPAGSGISFNEADVIDFGGVGECDFTGVTISNFNGPDNAWSDAVDANIVPDGNGTRVIGSAGNNFANINSLILQSNSDLEIISAAATSIIFDGGDTVDFTNIANIDFTNIGNVDFTGATVSGLSSGANTALSNLTSPTSLNQHLVPADASRFIGLDTDPFARAYLNALYMTVGGQTALTFSIASQVTLTQNFVPNNGTRQLGSAVNNFLQTHTNEVISNTALALNSGAASNINFGGVKADFSSMTGPLNVPNLAADPGAPVNGDMWYNTTGNQLKARVNGATVVLA